MNLSCRIQRKILALAPILFFAGAIETQAAFLDITALTPGVAGAFSGTLDGVTVSGAITTPNPSFSFSGLGTGYGDSTINGTSPQYSYCSLYTPCIPTSDTIGYASLHNNLPNAAIISIIFGSLISNPVFNVSGLDAMQYDFGLTAGLSGLVILSGNGGGGDGLQVLGNIISDAGPSSDATPPGTAPPATGPRSAWGSVQLMGTFSSLTIAVRQDGRGDSGSFTLSTVPEPSSLLLVGSCLAGLVGSGWRHRKQGPAIPKSATSS